MQIDNYWSKLSSRRIGRRRGLAVTGGAAAAAAVLSACGGSSGEDEDQSGLLSQPTDTTKQAKRGGVMRDRTHQDVQTLDILTSNAPHNSIGPHVYSALLQFEPGYLKPSQRNVIGDLAESWEWSQDGLSIVMKLRQGVKWHNKPPLNARDFDADDVLSSWNRFARLSSARTSLVNDVNADAPVLSLTASDSRTIVIKMKEPVIYAPGLFASNSAGNMVVVPRETDGTLDIRHEMIGTGPFVLANYTPSVGFAFKRNPDFYDKNYALVDEVDMPIIQEYAAALAQFKSGRIYSFGSSGNTPQIRQEEILQVKRDEPRIQVYQGDMGGGSTMLAFGWLPEGRSPFLDERVRQAVSMSIDRDLYLEVFHNVSDFESQGLPVETAWSSAIEGIEDNEGWWLDPKSKDFGANAKFYQHNPAEAKKLLAAAGYPDGFETKSNYVLGGELPAIPTRAEVLDGFMQEVGIRTRVNALDYLKEYTSLFRDGAGQYEGVLYRGGAGTIASHPVGELAGFYWSKGGPSFFGFSASGKNDRSGDPQVDAMIEKARVERNIDAARKLAHDLQRHLAKTIYGFRTQARAKEFVMAWPCRGNFRVFQGSRMNYQAWVDETKPPFTSA
jgi:peptide/nickel transport system substrate-binding protein